MTRQAAPQPRFETALPGAVVVQEVCQQSTLPLYLQPEWADRFPWLIQATTGRGGNGEFDLSFFTQTPVAQLLERWQALRDDARLGSVALARQVHGARIISHRQPGQGIMIHDAADGHVSAIADLTLAVSVADCVPISLIDTDARVVALLHAGWRGIAAGILELGLEELQSRGSRSLNHVYCHLGPAICGSCYEVGPEVHQALGLARPPENTPVDLRALLAARALAMGVPQGHVSISSFCTRCHADLFFSHRAGHSGRQMGLLGVRSAW